MRHRFTRPPSRLRRLLAALRRSVPGRPPALVPVLLLAALVVGTLSLPPVAGSVGGLFDAAAARSTSGSWTAGGHQPTPTPSWLAGRHPSRSGTSAAGTSSASVASPGTSRMSPGTSSGRSSRTSSVAPSPARVTATSTTAAAPGGRTSAPAGVPARTTSARAGTSAPARTTTAPSATPTSATAPSPTPTSATATSTAARTTATGGAPPVSAAEARVLALVNQQRTAAGCAPLTADPRLAALARAHSADMRDRHFFDHTNPDHQDPWDRAAAAGITNLRAENIAQGQPDAASVMDAWMGSAGHRANILDCSLRTLGVGVATGAGGPWWTQDFGG